MSHLIYDLQNVVLVHYVHFDHVLRMEIFKIAILLILKTNQTNFKWYNFHYV